MKAVETVRAVFDALDAGDTARARNLLADDFVHRNARKPGAIDADYWLKGHTRLHAAFPDVDHGVHDLSADGDIVAGVFQVRGTHSGVLDLPEFGLDKVEPTGRRFELPPEPFTAVVRDGKLVSIDVDPPEDGGLAEALRQLGIAG